MNLSKNYIRQTASLPQARGKLLILSIVLTLALTMVLPRLAQAALLDDRYHFSDYDPSNTNISEYCEWWFFNLYQPDIQAVIQYSLWDPAQTPGNP
jgi:hypothetical protein